MDQLLVILNLLAACNDVLLERVDAFLVLDHLLRLVPISTGTWMTVPDIEVTVTIAMAESRSGNKAESPRGLH